MHKQNLNTDFSIMAKADIGASWPIQDHAEASDFA